MTDILFALVAAALSLIALPLVDNAQRLFKALFGLQKQGVEETYSARLVRLTENLTSSTKEVDEIISELTAVAKEREIAIKKLEIELSSLEGREGQLKERIEQLENTPIAVAEHFAELTAAGEKRSAKRDYLLFGAGVAASTIIGIVLQIIIH